MPVARLQLAPETPCGRPSATLCPGAITSYSLQAGTSGVVGAVLAKWGLAPAVAAGWRSEMGDSHAAQDEAPPAAR